MTANVSVIIGAKDSENWLPITIKSLLQQSYVDWECIISVNGSSDKTLEIAKSISNDDKRFSVINSIIPNKSSAVNRAIISSKSNLIAILDADDLWTPKKLEHQVNIILNEDIDILGTQLEYIDENGNRIGNPPMLPISHEDCIKSLNAGNNPIANSSVIYQRSIHDKVGYYDPEKFAVEDYDMWMRSMRKGMRFRNLIDSHLMHRVHRLSNFNSSNDQQKYKQLVDITNVLYQKIK